MTYLYLFAIPLELKFYMLHPNIKVKYSILGILLSCFCSHETSSKNLICFYLEHRMSSEISISAAWFIHFVSRNKRIHLLFFSQLSSLFSLVLMLTALCIVQKLSKSRCLLRWILIFHTFFVHFDWECSFTTIKEGRFPALSIILRSLAVTCLIMHLWSID